MKQVSLISFAVILAFIVVTSGAFTRLTSAGLSCPDWPGCFHHFIAPQTDQEFKQRANIFAESVMHSEKIYPDAITEANYNQPEPIKAWTEMIHRYIAGTLGLLIFVIGMIAVKRRRSGPGTKPSIGISMLLMSVVLVQALLGKWTVTLKLLPLVVMTHLLGGFTILALLWWLQLNTKTSHIDGASHFRVWAVIGLIILAMQIALGAWTSTNYATLVCPHFPYCYARELFQHANFKTAFNIFNMHHFPLEYDALVAIQMTHRAGALITACYVSLLAVFLIIKKNFKLQKLGLLMLILLVLQITLGILNIELYAPLPLALLHNSVAALLLITMVTLTHVTFRRKKPIHG